MSLGKCGRIALKNVGWKVALIRCLIDPFLVNFVAWLTVEAVFVIQD